ncbi:hypothetical protein PBI_DUMBO_138 [Mycobacterium phage Dumbo]|uniref:hypothetical protein n=1 Tax=Mycobacterium phage Dumbo TaxID=1327764 RepID=UPI000332ABBE|nr:hypothetical protein PBI_DUMBO_138 [Mycobacterium phage Dumbo]AGM12877.1 hypothetical protein PBI_DUMBO_138 [Mycobacterium phage Dumbo]
MPNRYYGRKVVHMSNNHESKIIGVLRRGHFRCNDCIDFSDYDSVVRGVPGGARLECQYCGFRYAEAEAVAEAEAEAVEAEAVEAEAETAEAVELQSECQTCGSEAIDHYYGKDEFYSGAYCAEHAPIAYETSTGRPIFRDTRATFIVGGMNPTDKHVTTVYRNVHPDQVAARVAELEGRGWTRIYATFEAF